MRAGLLQVGVPGMLKRIGTLLPPGHRITAERASEDNPRLTELIVEGDFMPTWLSRSRPPIPITLTLEAKQLEGERYSLSGKLLAGSGALLLHTWKIGEYENFLAMQVALGWDDN